MGALVESRSIEAEIAACCHEIYAATDPEIALAQWKRMRSFMAERAEAKNRQYIRECQHRDRALAEECVAASG